jgi:23S rRNA (uracil1939-C5)-methyltransferase
LAAAGVRQLVVRIDDTGALDLTASPETADAKRDAVLADRIYRAGGFAGVRVGNTQCGHKAATLRAGGLATSVPLGSFSQVNRAANERLVSYVVDRAGPAGVLTVDLFAGSGNLSLPLAAAGHNVVGLDSDRKLLAAAASAARRAGISARCTFFPADLRRWGPWAIKNSAADIVVLDPPRSGAAAVAAALGRKLVPRRVVYVSCDPATLARDLARCTAQGYRCMEIQPFDFFPQTAHIEAVAILERTQ